MAPLEITRPDARRSALNGLVDYAGLFPPAALDMDAAVAEYRAARSGPDAWMVDRFICPAARLEELLTILAPTMEAGERPWRVAVTASQGWRDALTADAGAVRMFSDTAGGAASVELVEIRAPAEVAADPDVLGNDAGAVLRAFHAMPIFELPWDQDPLPAMKALVEVRATSGRSLGVKLRCGGLDAALFPSPEAVARFISAAARQLLPLKATAGLHHPFRHVDLATGFHHHGFINVLAATALAHAAADESVVTAVLADEDPDHFTLDRTGLAWHEHSVGAAELDAMRAELFVSYGSCSFEEPVEDLTGLGVLPVEVNA
jgi:hypothetical protein